MRAIEKLVSATQAISGERVKATHESLGEFWIKPCVSGEVRAGIYAEGKESTIKGCVAEIIARTTDEQGKPLFVKADRVAFMLEVSDDHILDIFELVKGASFKGKSQAAS